jgi:FeS assembly SUF system protein
MPNDRNDLPEMHQRSDSTGSPIDRIRASATESAVVEVLRMCYDPEIPVNIYDLGLIYTIDVDNHNHVKIQMTLTSPACPVAGSLPPEVERRVRGIDGVAGASVEVIWDPPWTPERMSEAARLELNF